MSPGATDSCPSPPDGGGARERDGAREGPGAGRVLGQGHGLPAGSAPEESVTFWLPAPTIESSVTEMLTTEEQP